MEGDEKFNFMKLPEPVQTLVLAYCDFKTIKAATETCTHLNELVFSEPQLSTRFNLKLNDTWNFEKIKDRMDGFLTSERSYSNVLITNSHLEAKLVKVFEAKGSLIRKLTIDIDCSYNAPDVVQLLVDCGNLRTLHLQGSARGSDKKERKFDYRLDYRRLFLPELKSLKVNRSASFPLEVLGNVRGLEEIVISDCRNRYWVGDFNENIIPTDLLEEFILQQHNLKVLKIKVNEPDPNRRRGLFRDEKLKDVKFKLEELKVNSFALLAESAKTFFQKQRSSLKKVELLDFSLNDSKMDSISNEILAEIFALPKLHTLSINLFPGKVFSILQDIRNNSLKTLNFEASDTERLEELVQLFPNLEKINLISYDDRGLYYNLTMPSKLLAKLTLCRKNVYNNHDVKLDVKLFIVPTNMSDDPEVVAEDVFKFLERNRPIDELTIGDHRWIDSNFSLPTSFWKKLFESTFMLKAVAANDFNAFAEMLHFLDHPTIRRFEAATRSGLKCYRHYKSDEANDREYDDETSE